MFSQNCVPTGSGQTACCKLKSPALVRAAFTLMGTPPNREPPRRQPAKPFLTTHGPPPRGPQAAPHPRYSSRNSTSGSTDIARRAGIQVAINPTSNMDSTTPPNTSGSRGVA